MYTSEGAGQYQTNGVPPQLLSVQQLPHLPLLSSSLLSSSEPAKPLYRPNTDQDTVVVATIAGSSTLPSEQPKIGLATLCWPEYINPHSPIVPVLVIGASGPDRTRLIKSLSQKTLADTSYTSEIKQKSPFMSATVGRLSGVGRGTSQPRPLYLEIRYENFNSIQDVRKGQILPADLILAIIAYRLCATAILIDNGASISGLAQGFQNMVKLSELSNTMLGDSEGAPDLIMVAGDQPPSQLGSLSIDKFVNPGSAGSSPSEIFNTIRAFGLSPLKEAEFELSQSSSGLGGLSNPSLAQVSDRTHHPGGKPVVGSYPSNFSNFLQTVEGVIQSVPIHRQYNLSQFGELLHRLVGRLNTISAPSKFGIKQITMNRLGPRDERYMIDREIEKGQAKLLEKLQTTQAQLPANPVELGKNLQKQLTTCLLGIAKELSDKEPVLIKRFIQEDSESLVTNWTALIQHVETKNSALADVEADNLLQSFLSRCKMPSDTGMSNTEAILYLQRLKKFFFEFMDYCGTELKSPLSCRIEMLTTDRRLAIDSVSNILEGVENLLRVRASSDLGNTCRLVFKSRFVQLSAICY